MAQKEVDIEEFYDRLWFMTTLFLYSMAMDAPVIGSTRDGKPVFGPKPKPLDAFKRVTRDINWDKHRDLLSRYFNLETGELLRHDNQGGKP